MQTQSVVSSAANSGTVQTGKIIYIDNLKVLLTVLVVLHHTLITYGAPGGWYYTEKTTHTAALVPMIMAVATNQSFFMGFFFFLSAYFTELSYQKKGAVRFMADRLKRLGIPLIFYSLILSPLLSYLVYRFGDGHRISYWQYLQGFHHWVDFGVLWFVAALLLFNLLYIGANVLLTATPALTREQLPDKATIIWFALTLALGSYLVRSVFPIGWVLQPVGFQLGHFAQYIALFILGLAAARGQWLHSICFKKSRFFGVLAIAMIIIGFPLMFYIKEITHSAVDTFNGNGYWQSLMYATWEQFTGIFIMTALLGTARKRWQGQSLLLKKMSRAAFAVYIFHPLVLISLSMLFKPWPVDPAVKLLMVAPLAVAGSFALGSLLVKIPGIRAVI